MLKFEDDGYKIAAEGEVFELRIRNTERDLQVILTSIKKENIFQIQYSETFTLKKLQNIFPISEIFKTVQGTTESIKSHLIKIIRTNNVFLSIKKDKAIVTFVFPSSNKEFPIILPLVVLSSKDKILAMTSKISECSSRITEIENKLTALENNWNERGEDEIGQTQRKLFHNINEKSSTNSEPRESFEILPVEGNVGLSINNSDLNAISSKRSLKIKDVFYNVQERILQIYHDIEIKEKKLDEKINSIPKFKDQFQYKILLKKSEAITNQIEKVEIMNQIKLIDYFIRETNIINEQIKKKRPRNFIIEDLFSLVEESVLTFTRIMSQELNEKEKEIVDALSSISLVIDKIVFNIQHLLKGIYSATHQENINLVSNLESLLSENISKKFLEKCNAYHEMQKVINEVSQSELRAKKNEEKIKLLQYEIDKLQNEKKSFLSKKAPLKKEGSNQEGGKVNSHSENSLRRMKGLTKENQALKASIDEMNMIKAFTNEEKTTMTKEPKKVLAEKLKPNHKASKSKEEFKIPWLAIDEILGFRTGTFSTNDKDASTTRQSLFSKTKREPKKRTINKDLLRQIEIEYVIKDHNAPIYSLCLLKDGRLGSCSWESTIKIFNLSDYGCDMTLFGHTGNVYYICSLSRNHLASASHDKTIRIWDITEDDYKCVKVLKGHDWDINKVIQLTRDRIASCSDDETLIIWNALPPYDQIKRLKKHTSYVESIIELKNKEFIVSGGVDWKILFWDNKTYKCTYEISDVICFNRNSLIEYEDNHLLIVGGYKKITLINLLNFQVENSIEIPEGGYICSIIELIDDSLLCGDAGGHLFHLDIDNCKIIESKEHAHESSIYGLLLLDENTFASCSNDKSIKIWKVTTKPCIAF